MKSATIVKHKNTINSKLIASFVFSFLIFAILVAMVAQPQTYAKTALNALNVWATVLLPTLFPFLLYTKFLTKLGFIEPVSKTFSPVTSRLFNTSGISSFVYLMSIISGYPVGAKITTDLYLEGKISQGEANRIISFCANCGPMFIIGTVGVGFLGNKMVGYVILVSHILGSIINGLIYRKKMLNNTYKLPLIKNQKTDADFLSTSVLTSTNSMFVVGSFIVVFFVLIEFLNNILGIQNPNVLSSVFNGLLEITHGCKDIALLDISVALKGILCCFVLTFGGLATAMQSITFLKKANIKFGYFLLTKLTHAIISTAICAILCLVIF